jgi:regulatory protein YycH of two-component signal transduction system YycFG
MTMGDTMNTVRVNVTITIDGETLQTIVQTAKDIVGRNEKGHYRIDTADLLEDLLSKFIKNRDFAAFAADSENYGFLDPL